MKKYLVIGVIILAVVVAGWWLSRGSDTPLESIATTPTEDPLDVTLDFFNQWLEARQSTTSDAFTGPVIQLPIVSDALRARVQSATTTVEIDPILCQATLPPRVGGRVLYDLPDEAQIMMLARGLDERAAQQSIVTLRAINGPWVITDITCANGETAPVREFSFEREGFLLKSVPPPLNSDFWHLVFAENGINGHTAPLTFTDASICIAADGTEANCDESTFIEPAKVLLQGEMTESGVTVVRVRFE